MMATAAHLTDRFQPQYPSTLSLCRHRRPKEVTWRDGVFDAATTGGVIFRAATELDANTIADVQACVRRRLLRVFVRRGLLPRDDARAMAQWAHGGGFSVDGSVRIAAADRGTCPAGIAAYCVRSRIGSNVANLSLLCHWNDR
jgi:hypothetical protein